MGTYVVASTVRLLHNSSVGVVSVILWAHYFRKQSFKENGPMELMEPPQNSPCTVILKYHRATDQCVDLGPVLLVAGQCIKFYNNSYGLQQMAPIFTQAG